MGFTAAPIFSLFGFLSQAQRATTDAARAAPLRSLQHSQPHGQRRIN
jgi:hypothetical protein